jgi:hypothetical protein
MMLDDEAPSAPRGRMCLLARTCVFAIAFPYWPEPEFKRLMGCDAQ